MVTHSPKYESHFYGPVQGVVIGDNNAAEVKEWRADLPSDYKISNIQNKGRGNCESDWWVYAPLIAVTSPLVVIR